MYACLALLGAYLMFTGVVPLLELSLTDCLDVNDRIDPAEPSRHAFASSANVLWELCEWMWNECVIG